VSGRCSRQSIRAFRTPCDQHQRTAKWTAIADRLAGTPGHTGALIPQVKDVAALVDGSHELHGMQEARGSSPLSSTLFCARVRAISDGSVTTMPDSAALTLGVRVLPRHPGVMAGVP
jgi:hypothetical protein